MDLLVRGRRFRKKRYLKQKNEWEYALGGKNQDRAKTGAKGDGTSSPPLLPADVDETKSVWRPHNHQIRCLQYHGNFNPVRCSNRTLAQQFQALAAS